MIFNKSKNGGAELRELLGFLDASTNFDRWKTWIDLSIRQIVNLLGKDIFTLAENHYQSENYQRPVPENPTPDETTTPKASEFAAWQVLDGLVNRMQLANALFAYVKLLPSLDVGHSNSGRKKDVGENERAVTANEAYKDETNILNLAYEALESLIEYAEAEKVEAWLNSPLRQHSSELLVPNPETFNHYYQLNSARMYYSLLPLIRETQKKQVAPIVGATRMAEIITAFKTKADDQTETHKKLIALTEDYIRLPLVLDTLALALQRLPIEIFPEGLMQSQVIGTIKEKRIATEEVRLKMIKSLSADAAQGWTALQNELAILNGAKPEEIYVIAPKAVSKGFRI